MKLRCEIANDWSQIYSYRDAWNKLAAATPAAIAYLSFDWFDCWYRAYSLPGSERVVAVWDDTSLRALLPCWVTQRRVAGVSYQVISYAANGHSPRSLVIAAPGDIEAAEAALTAVIDYNNKIDFVVMPGIPSGSDLDKLIRSLPSSSYHIEHRYESPMCNIRNGWDAYEVSHSASFRMRINRTMNRARSVIGEPALDVVSPPYDAESALDRLRMLSAKTWQHRNGSGLFSTAENVRFYTSIVRRYVPSGRAVLSFVRCAETDISFLLALVNDRGVACACKTGYDPDYARCSPGVICLYLVLRDFTSREFSELDLIGEQSDEKMFWATGTRKHANFWLFLNPSLKGAALHGALQLRQALAGKTRL